MKFLIILNDETESIKQSFQDGCNTLVSKCTELGVTPISNSPIDISNAISTIATNNLNNGWSSGHTAGWNEGRTQGQNDVKNNPNGYGLYNKTQYDQNYNNGYNSGYNAGQSAAAYKGYDYTLKICCGTSDNTQNESRIYLPLTGASSVHINGSIINQYAAGDITINNENVWHRDNAYASHSIADTWKSTDPNGTGSIYIYLYGINTHSTGINLNVSVH